MRLQFTHAARADIDHIFDFTLERWGKGQALRYLRGIQKCCDGLNIGLSNTRCADHVQPGYFKAAAGAYMIYFRQTEDSVTASQLMTSVPSMSRLPLSATSAGCNITTPC